MGKVSHKTSHRHTNHHDNPDRPRKQVVRRQHSQRPDSKAGPKSVGAHDPTHSPSTKSAGKPTKQTSQQQKLKIPFDSADRILLVGEGDFSFAHSVYNNHHFGSLTATCFDSRDVLVDKYPDAPATIRALLPSQSEGQHHSKQEQDGEGSDQPWEGFSPASDDNFTPTETKIQVSRVTVHYNIDATKLSTTHKKVLKPHSPFTKIIFNFPHVGGLSTDVNRQVRSNQQLLVGFFNTAKALLATTKNPARPIVSHEEQLDEDDEIYADEDDFESASVMPPVHGQIIVTLFEGEPYTLWNIRDLARHCGLKVVESFKFPWSAYPGYRHARTIGDIVTGKDRSDEGKRKGAWRGEEREARSYVLALKDAEDAPRRKRKKTRDDDSD